ncbi:MAG: efflux RND transporter periplasmic adaptor subunit [Bacteroidales bacterium]|nr:efflux RND transporter periplasmic adaptor subunit [Bacteroidales bacterium]
MMKLYFLSGIFLSATLFISCGSPKSESGESEVSAIDTISISKVQFESSGMELGRPLKRIFAGNIRSNGKVTTSPAGMARVSSLMAGKIKRIAVNTGDRVTKGQLLCTLESTEFVKLQQEYAESSSMLKAVHAEYERQKALADDNISSQKSYMNAESEYKSLYSKCEGLKTTLLMLGLNADKVKEGVMVSEISLYAPINGYISALEVETGSFADPQQSIMQLVDLNQLQLKLSVFEKDLKVLNPGSKISFFSPGNPAIVYHGELLSYSRTIDPETKAVTVIGSIQPSERPLLINEMYIEAEIFTGEKEVMALPDEAILKSGNSRLVLVLTSSEGKEMKFTRKEVKTGLSSNGFTEILSPEGLENVLVKGGFNLVME